MEAECDSSSFCGASSISSYRASRALDFVCRALALERTHSNSLCSVFCSRESAYAKGPRRLREGPQKAPPCGVLCRREPHISPYLPISPHISPYLPISPLQTRARLALLPHRLRLLLEPLGVVALERLAFAPLELEDPAARLLEEVAVVPVRSGRCEETPFRAARLLEEVAVARDRHHRALEALEVRLQPRDALRVEVVGRLVEQQQVVPLEQQPRLEERRARE